MRIKIGDRDWKNVPLPWIENDIRIGKCRVEIQAEGFKKSTPQVLMIEPDKTAGAVFKLEPEECGVIFKSNVLGTQVFEGETLLGKTGEVIPLKPFKEHTLTLKAQGFRDREMKVLLEEPGLKNEKYDVMMEKIPEIKRKFLACPTSKYLLRLWQYLLSAQNLSTI